MTTLGEPIFVEKGADTIQREIGPNITQYTITNNVTTESPLLCNDGSSPESNTGLCSDGLPPSFNFSFCDPNSPTLRINFTGNKVSELQLHLTQLGYGELLKPSGIDGKFGPFTQNAVKAFQRDNDLQIDGIVGPMTWGAICKAISSFS